MEEITFDVQRTLANKQTAWRYENPPSILEATYLSDLPDTQSKTGEGFSQSQRAKCFDLPATSDIWIRFDTYFDGKKRWRAYNEGAAGWLGICSYSNSEQLGVCTNGSVLKNINGTVKTGAVQSWLLHMVSGTDGLIEAWLDGEQVYTFNGDVNNGEPFEDIFLQADAATTFFSNVIISNGEIGHGEGKEILRCPAAINIANTDINDPAAPHFNFSGTQYAKLPLEVLPGAKTYTLEIKFKTASTKDNSYYAELPTLIGTHALFGGSHLQLFLSGGKLGFGSTWWIPLVCLNDDSVHCVTLSVDNAAGKIKLTCDDYPVEWNGTKTLSASYPLLLACNEYNYKAYLPCDIYEARFWSVVRAGWGEIDGSEEGLECWLLPSEDGLLDYSGHERHATLYGEPLFIGAKAFQFDFQRLLNNQSDILFKLERRLANVQSFRADLQRRVEQRTHNDYHFDVQRNVTRPVTAYFNLQREVINGSVATFDFERHIANDISLAFDLEREVTFDGLLTKILPESILQDPKIYAAAYALDKQLISVFADVRQALHIPRLDELTGDILDLLNWQFHTDLYEPAPLSNAQKRALIRQAVAWHRRKGTVAAVEEICAACWSECTLEELGGYLFQITTKGFPSSEDDFNFFRRMIGVAKNVRSHLTHITVDYSPPNPLNLNLGLGRAAAGYLQLKRPKPKDLTLSNIIALASYRGGLIHLNRPKPKDLNILTTFAVSRAMTGRIQIGDTTPLPKPKFTFAAPFFISTARNITGRIWLIQRHEAADIDDDPLPPDFVGTYIWMRFRGADGSKRAFKLRNAREDVTKEELKAAADYVVQSGALLNSKGFPLTQTVRVSVNVKAVTDIPL